MCLGLINTERGSEMREFRVEVVIRKERVLSQDIDRFREVVKKYRELETENRIILNFPQDWEGLRDGTIVEMLKTFNEAMFVGISFFTDDASLIVRDFEGNGVDKFETVLNNRRVFKYVKKRLLLVEELEKGRVYKAEGYLLDLKYPNPVRKVLDCYIDVEEVGFDWVGVLRK